MLSRSSASLVKQNALLGQMPLVPSYLGTVATGCWMPNSTSAPKSMNSRSPHFARDAITALKIVLPGFYLSGAAAGELTTGSNTTYTAAIEYPAGTFTQVLFGGNAAGTATDGGMLTSDFVNVTIPNGALFWVRIFGNNATALPVRFYGLNTGCGGQYQYSSTVNALTDVTMGGTITNGAQVPGGLYAAPNSPSFAPCAIIALTTKWSAAIIGDSRAAGKNDAYFGANCDQGNLARSLGSFAAYLNLSVGGDTLQGWVASHTNRLALAGYGYAVILQLTFNDIATRTVAQMQADINTIRNYFSAATPVYLCTSEPNSSIATVSVSSLAYTNNVCTATVASTAGLAVGQLINVAGATPTACNGSVIITAVPSSTTFTYTAATSPGASGTATGTITYQDSWTQISTQTTSSNNANRVIMNNWKRALPAGFKGCLELADPVEAGRDSGLWTSQYGAASADGTHAFSALYLVQKASGAVAPATLV